MLFNARSHEFKAGNKQTNKSLISVLAALSLLYDICRKRAAFVSVSSTTSCGPFLLSDPLGDVWGRGNERTRY